MRFISSKVHAILDYIMGLVLILSPWLFGFSEHETAKWIIILAGALMLLYSLFTNYEYSISKSLPFTVHLFLDIVAGLFLAISPWLFGFADEVYLPHLIFGIAEVGAALMTHKQPGRVDRSEYNVQV